MPHENLTKFMIATCLVCKNYILRTGRKDNKKNGGMDINMSDEQKDLAGIAELAHGEQEVPFLSPKWLNVLESDYIDVYDDALDILEDAPRVNTAGVPPHNNRYPGYTD